MLLQSIFILIGFAVIDSFRSSQRLLFRSSDFGKILNKFELRSLKTKKCLRMSSVDEYFKVLENMLVFFLIMTLTKRETPFFQGLDAYQILEVDRKADMKQIKSAYRKLVSKWHPDKFPDDENKKTEGGKRMEKINRG